MTLRISFGARGVFTRRIQELNENLARRWKEIYIRECFEARVGEELFASRTRALSIFFCNPQEFPTKLTSIKEFHERARLIGVEATFRAGLKNVSLLRESFWN